MRQIPLCKVCSEMCKQEAVVLFLMFLMFNFTVVDSIQNINNLQCTKLKKCKKIPVVLLKNLLLLELVYKNV